ncbi:class I SAM-dependent methyltransferase [Stieleria varia]|uniref:Class I SAM-dependent methyltransferase n=1 Tax=Stieleria varia TaxID=2528005 RepID=A0A5C6B3C5_9BACT|nr:class I SAM-dependent methyltransferase [Stieleria varia]TWU05961.1 hypothetical protein Pla52n_16770 [Stieleria varia]
MRIVRDLAKRLPGIRNLVRDRDRLLQELATWKVRQSYPPGHYYSPVPSANDVAGIGRKSGREQLSELPGIALNWDAQEALITKLAAYYSEIPFGETKEQRGEHRYYFDNGFYCYADGILLYSLLRHLKPAKLIEIGSGFSSCLTLDVNELFLNGTLHCTFIEPYPERLHDNMRPTDAGSAKVMVQKVQDVPLSTFDELNESDILFIDSSHVGKASSDVNFLFFEVLPRLKPGVWIHIHDVFYPFEYPEEWILAGRSWNEAYMLRCLLMHSSGFEINLWGDALCTHRPDLMRSLMPMCFKNTGAGIWLRRVGK